MAASCARCTARSTLEGSAGKLPFAARDMWCGYNDLTSVVGPAHFGHVRAFSITREHIQGLSDVITVTAGGHVTADIHAISFPFLNMEPSVYLAGKAMDASAA